MENSKRILWSWLWGKHTPPVVDASFKPASFTFIHSWIHQSQNIQLCMSALWQRSYWLHKHCGIKNSGMAALMELAQLVNTATHYENYNIL
jgi:hypothetical protein